MKRFFDLEPKIFVWVCLIVFSASIGLAYVLYPHWVTFSHFALHGRTLPLFLLAMVTVAVLLWRLAGELTIRHFTASAILMRFSFVSVLFVMGIPYAGGSGQKSLHNLAALLFVVFAAVGVITAAARLKDWRLQGMGISQIVICVIELMLLARYTHHPVKEWVWVILQVIVTAVFMFSLTRLFRLLTDGRGNSGIQKS